MIRSKQRCSLSSLEQSTALAGRRLRIAYMGATDWASSRQRPQHLASEVAQFHDVYYIRPVPVFRGIFRPRAATKTDREVKLVQPCVLSPGRLRVIARLNDALTLRSIRKTINDVDVLWLCHPLHVSLIGRCHERIVVYDMMDNHVSFASPGREAITDALERELLRRADVVFASSAGLAERARSLAEGRVAVAANGVEFDRFVKAATQRLKRPPDLPEEGVWTVGFYGTLGSWLDTAWLSGLALAHPDWQVVLIGPRRGADISTLCALSNVRWLGPKPYEDLPAYLQHVAVWTVPFVRSALTADVDPVKVYEYLAAGKPVVATDLPALVKLQSVVRLVSSAADFVRGIEQAFSEPSSGVSRELVECRCAAVREHTWRARAAEVCRVLDQAVNVECRA